MNGSTNIDQEAARRAREWWDEVFNPPTAPKWAPATEDALLAEEHARREIASRAQSIADAFRDAGFDPDMDRVDWNAVLPNILDCQRHACHGFLVRGGPGCGKSTLIAAVATLCRGNCTRINCADAAQCDWLDWDEVRDRARGCRYLLIDDLGSDDVARVYGEVRDRVAAWIKLWGSWADRARGNPRRAPMLIATTNLNGEQVRQRYGERVFSVLKYLRPVIWHGDDQRGRMQTRVGGGG